MHSDLRSSDEHELLPTASVYLTALPPQFPTFGGWAKGKGHGPGAPLLPSQRGALIVYMRTDVGSIDDISIKSSSYEGDMSGLGRCYKCQCLPVHIEKSSSYQIAAIHVRIRWQKIKNPPADGMLFPQEKCIFRRYKSLLIPGLHVIQPNSRNWFLVVNCRLS